MIKFASVALAAALGVAGVSQSPPAAASPSILVAVPARDVAIVAPAGFVPAHYRPWYGHDRYWHDRYWHERYGHHRYDRFQHRWYWD